MAELTNFRAEVQQASSDADREVSALIARVGARVRRARDRQGIPRRVLSEKSGVSPRYLAQLEAGEGNISIGLLQRVADALGLKIDWLVGEDDPWSSEALRVADLFRTVDTATQARVLAMLCPGPTEVARARRVCLIGLRGAGKSTLGRRAGAALAVPFIELNREIEAQSGMPVGELMALYGQEGYRRLEAEAIDRVVATHERVILAVAGGIVSEPETYNDLLSRFHTVWVKATPAEHMARVRDQGDTRPMAGNPEAMEQLKSILTAREALYERALAKLDTSGCSEDDSLKELLALIRRNHFLD